MEKAGANWEENAGLWPRVSVWVAARNEEANLPLCLAALSKQDYPGDFEVWIGNDHSTDQTGAMAAAFCEQDARFHTLAIPDSEGPVRGKAWVLAHLAQASEGELFLVADADMQMNPGWIRSMVEGLRLERVDLLNGTTTTRSGSLFSALQSIDWLIPQGTFAWLSQLDVTYTAMGNNMAITRRAYEATGGYFQLPFSLTEDFELYRAAQQKGYKLRHLYSRRVLGYSAPQANPGDWFEQHLRWMVGFDALSFRQQFVLYGQLAFYPVWVLAFWLLPPLALVCTGIFILRYLYNAVLLLRIGEYRLLLFQPLYELLFWPVYFSLWLRFSGKKEVRWKGRRWKK
jgi:cellulose synthase/poly-beta-1,6-N-acetylglucosamine synthase-like glycosyltransferase